jgi:hypothetical protein
MTIRLCLLALVCPLFACASMGGKSIQSRAVLERTQTAEKVEVKHVLLGYSWLASRYRQMGMTLDPRAESRNEKATEDLAVDILTKLQKGDAIEPLMAEHSEDPGSAKDGRSYAIEPSSPFVAPFKDLSLRLNLGESGIVKSDFGYHIVKRIQ